jgi:hypothetical protein
MKIDSNILFKEDQEKQAGKYSGTHRMGYKKFQIHGSAFSETDDIVWGCRYDLQIFGSGSNYLCKTSTAFKEAPMRLQGLDIFLTGHGGHITLTAVPFRQDS